MTDVSSDLAAQAPELPGSAPATGNEAQGHPAPDIADASTLVPDAPASTIDAVLGFLDVGGPVLWLLAAMSVVTLALALAKLMQFSVARLGGTGKRAPLTHVVAATTETFSSTGADRAMASDAGRRVARRVMQPLESGLATLGMIAMLSPLIGLLGTVLGMIDAFQALEEAGSTVDPSLLSAGIWVALLTTAAGLVVAIPATLAHGWFESRLGRFADDAECAIGDTVAHLAPNRPDLRLAAE